MADKQYIVDIAVPVVVKVKARSAHEAQAKAEKALKQRTPTLLTGDGLTAHIDPDEIVTIQAQRDGAKVAEYGTTQVVSSEAEARIGYVARFAAPPDAATLKREAAYRAAAIQEYHSEGSTEVDEDALVSESDEGAYVQAWVWVGKEG